MLHTTLPVFRVMGLTAATTPEHAHKMAADLRQQFATHTPNIQGFSTTVYCVYRHIDAQTVQITVGRLVANDTALPENLGDVWIAPQNYAVFDIAQSPAETWAEIQHNAALKRRFHADFEIYPAYGLPKIYIGVQGDVEIEEAIL